MKRSVPFVLLAIFGITPVALAHGWCDFEDEYVYYDAPSYCEEAPLHEVIIDLFRGYGESPVWEEPGWIAPWAERPRVNTRRQIPLPKPEVQAAVREPRRVVAGYKAPVPPVMPEPKRDVEIEITPDSEAQSIPDVSSKNSEELSNPMAVPVPGAPGFVFSPFDGEKRKVDVRGLPPGSLARDPYTKEVFRVP